MQAKFVLLLCLLVFAIAPIVTTLTTTFIAPSANMVNLTRVTGCNIFFGVQPMGDPIDDPFPPGVAW